MRVLLGSFIAYLSLPPRSAALTAMHSIRAATSFIQVKAEANQLRTRALVKKRERVARIKGALSDWGKVKVCGAMVDPHQDRWTSCPELPCEVCALEPVLCVHLAQSVCGTACLPLCAAASRGP